MFVCIWMYSVINLRKKFYVTENDALAERLPFIRNALAWRVDRMVSIAEWN